MKLTNWTDLPYEKSIFLGGRNQDFCNRYKLTDNGMVEVQHIYRYAKPSETQVMTCDEFDKWLQKVK